MRPRKAFLNKPVFCCNGSSIGKKNSSWDHIGDGCLSIYLTLEMVLTYSRRKVYTTSDSNYLRRSNAHLAKQIKTNLSVLHRRSKTQVVFCIAFLRSLVGFPGTFTFSRPVRKVMLIILILYSLINKLSIQCINCR
jgi:hypothetical protein